MPSERVSVISGLRRIWFGRSGSRRCSKSVTNLDIIVYGTVMLATIVGVFFVIYGPDYQYEITVTNGESIRVYHTDQYSRPTPDGHITIYQNNRVLILSGDEITIERKTKNDL